MVVDVVDILEFGSILEVATFNTSIILLSTCFISDFHEIWIYWAIINHKTSRKKKYDVNVNKFEKLISKFP